MYRHPRVALINLLFSELFKLFKRFFKWLFVLAFLCNTASAQQSNYVGGGHGYLRLITGYDVEKTSNDIGYFLKRMMSFQNVDVPHKSDTSSIVLSYVKGAIGKKPVPMTITYSGYWATAGFMVKSASIKGAWDDVASFFIRYWDNVPIKWEDLKEKPAVMKINLTDQVVFKNEPNGMATVTVVDNRPQ